MPYVILLRRPHGWSDDLGQHGPTGNSWPSVQAAHAAAQALRAATGETLEPYRVVDQRDLAGYELIA